MNANGFRLSVAADKAQVRTLILGILELIAAASLFGSGTFGRLFGMFAGSLAALGALLTIPAYPLWSIAIFALSLWIVYGLGLRRRRPAS